MSKPSPVITKARLCTDLVSLGIAAGDTIMLHASVKAVGRVVGGPDMVIESVLDVVGPEGSLMMMVSWEDSPTNWPDDLQEEYFESAPGFDAKRARAYRKYSILTEYLRIWPGAERSGNPDLSFAAIGAKAGWLMSNQPLNYGFGVGSPLEKLGEVGGKVLLLGATFDSLTLLHYSESIASIEGKRVIRYRVPLLTEGERLVVEIEQFDDRGHLFEWEGESYFHIIAREYLARDRGRTGKVGNAESYLFDAAGLNSFAVAWLEENLTRQRLRP